MTVLFSCAGGGRRCNHTTVRVRAVRGGRAGGGVCTRCGAAQPLLYARAVLRRGLAQPMFLYLAYQAIHSANNFHLQVVLLWSHIVNIVISYRATARTTSASQRPRCCVTIDQRQIKIA